MFGRSSRPIVFNPYGRRRSRWRLPRWLVLLVLGGLLGAAGVLLVQERYLPPRLSAGESRALRDEIEAARRDRTTAQTALAQTTSRMNAALSERAQLQADVSAGRAAAQNARLVVSSLVAALPPDPRGGAIEVRAARFEVRAGSLGYDLVLTRGRSTGSAPINAVLQIVVGGSTARGSETSAPPTRSEVSIADHQSVRGSIELPAGFKPREATITLTDAAGKRLGMRVIRVDG
ncbi:MAG: hypothetical protein ABIX46_08040 [Burkholderiaceae bacterium]